MQAAEFIGATQGSRQPALDPRSYPVYAVLAAGLGIELIVLAVSDFHLGGRGMAMQLGQMCLFVAIAWFSRRHAFPAVATLLEAIAVPGIAGALAVTGTVYLAAVSVPFIDPALDAADRAIGFDFMTLLALYREQPWLASISRYAYVSFAIQGASVPAILALCGARRRLWILLNAWVLSLLIAVVIFPFAPAAGPFAFHGVTEDVFGQWTRLFPWQTGPAIEALRSGEMRDISAAARGFISIPSFHAAAGVLFAWAAWPSRWLRWPMVLLNLALIGSAIVTGAHYLVDLIAGVALAAAALVAATKWVERAERPPLNGSEESA
jgi:membrane-associated phospholipid phosphatase